MPTKRIIDSWLKSIVPHDLTPEALSDVLTDRGIEVVAIDNRTSALQGFVVGEVLVREQHPNADRLAVCTVTTGGDTTMTVVCGAPNVAAGQKIVFAPVGTFVKTAGFTIERRKLRGVVSEGMICSAAELGLGDDHDGILVLPQESQPGRPIAEILGDVIYDIDVTANRPDWLNHIGVARELSAVTGGELFLPPIEFEMPDELGKPGDLSSVPAFAGMTSDAISVEIADPALCPRYAARVIRGISNGPSPTWLKETIEKMGLRSRNIVVDATSYVLFECGHPLHAFDYDKILGQRIEVRSADGGETFVTLDGKEHELPLGALLICDAERPVAIAGVMGGANSEITDETTNVLLESAYFNPSSIRRTSKLLNISTDASYRFERGADVERIAWAIDRAAQLIQKLAGGEVLEGMVDVRPIPPTELIITLRFARTVEILGVDISPEQQMHYLQTIGFDISSASETSCAAAVPSWRVDVFQEIDLIEEIIRCHGYNTIPSDTRANISFDLTIDPMQQLVKSTRNFFVDSGCNEIASLYLTDPDTSSAYGTPVELRNALGRDFSTLRTSLVPTMARTIAHNQRHSRTNLRMFEVGTAFRRSSSSEGVIPGIIEMTELAVVFTGIAEPFGWGIPERTTDLYDLRGTIEHYAERVGLKNVTWEARDNQAWGFGAPSLAMLVDGQEVGRIGPFDEQLLKQHDIDGAPVVAVIDLERIVESCFAQSLYVAPSKFPVVSRDISILVDAKIPNAAIEATIRNSGGDLLRDITLFDIYSGKGIEPGKISMSYTLFFSSHERTLEVETIDGVMAIIVKSLADEQGASLRGNA